MNPPVPVAIDAADADPMCVVGVGHTAPTPARWRERNAPLLVVCDHHRSQYDGYGRFEWNAVSESTESP